MRIDILAACAATTLFVRPAESPAEPVLAEVAGQQITASELKAFSDAVDDVHKMGKTGVGADSLMLESLIDKTVLLKEAESTGIDSEQGFAAKIAVYHRQKVLTKYKAQEINRKVVVSEEELLEQQNVGSWDRALRIAGILQETEEEARKTRDEVLAGADFGDLARERSLYEETRDQGGVFGRYLRKEDVSAFLTEAIFKLKVGEISEPLRFIYGKKWRYVIIKLVDEMPVPLYDVRDRVLEEVYGRKRSERAKVVADSLWLEYRPEIKMDGVETVFSERGSLEADQEVIRQLPLCTYRGGSITLDEFLQFVPEGKRDPKHFADTDMFVKFLKEGVVPQELFIAEATAKGLDQDPEILRTVGLYRQDQLLQEVRLRHVDRMVTVSEAEARTFYDEHPEVFQTPDKIAVTEILLGMPDEAQWIREQLEAGEDAEQLAMDYTIREGMAHHEGRITVARDSRHRTLYEAAKELQIGDIFGPVKTHSGYSVCKIIGRETPTLRPYADETRRAKAFVKIRKRKHGFVDYVRTLREKHSVRVFYEELPKLQSS